MNEVPDARTALAQTLESEASSSARKAQQYQDDRTERWADAALACAAYVRALPDGDDERVHRIAAACAWNHWQDDLHLGKDASLWASRCDLSPEPFLDALAMAAEADAERDKDDARKRTDSDAEVLMESRRESATSLANRVVQMAWLNDSGWDGDGRPALLLTSWMGPITDPGYRDRQNDLMGAVVGVALALASVVEQVDPGRVEAEFNVAPALAEEEVAAPH